ncbi:hypothetical protein EV175_002379 [Coemansia sp. RSA 1933]|nr:hypothetical protein EV175_002379 [Coemansia sp. RSA 1933]
MDNLEDSATTDMGPFNLGTSTLLAASKDTVSKPNHSTRYDPLGQLLDSDSDSDNEDNAPTKDDARSPHGSPLPEQRKSPVQMSAVARLAAAARRRAQEASGENGPLSFDSDSSDDAIPARMQTTLSAPMRVHSDTDSDPTVSDVASPPQADKGTLEEPAGKKNPKKHRPRAKEGSKPRAASKAAMALIHEESARLIRETAVAVNPMDFTRVLELDDFFAKFDTMALQRTQEPRKKRNIAAALAKSTSHKASLVQYDSDGDDYELEIVDNCATPMPNNPIVRNGRKGLAIPKTSQKQQSGEGGLASRGKLESILKYGSQPIHLTAGQTSGLQGMQRTDGSRALKDLNNALLDAMYSERTTGPKPARTVAPMNEEPDNMDASGSMDGQSSSEDEAQDEDDSDEDDDVDMEEERGSVVVPRKNRAVVVSDDDDDSNDDIQPAKATTEDIRAKPESKAKFLSMFKMPAAKPATGTISKPATGTRSKPTTTTTAKSTTATTAMAAPPPKTAEPVPSNYSRPNEQNEDSITTGSQDPLYLLSSQVDQINTQDSLLMTPDPLPNNVDDIMGLGTQLALDSDTHIFESQQSQIESTGHIPESEAVPTQLTQQPTQPTQATQLTAKAGDAFSSLPTLVRKALVPSQSHQEDAAQADDEPVSVSPLPLPTNTPDVMAQSPDMAVEHEQSAEDSLLSMPKATSGGRRFIRRHTNKTEGKLSRTKKREIRTEFIEAEAEEGESTDSDNEAGAVRHGKFDWGEAPPKSKPAGPDDDEEEEDDLDMDTDEEEAALLADPMINNEVVEDRKADQAIRDLHRQQDLEQDEQDIQDLVKDINTGRLRNRANGGRTGFALADDEDYNDRQTRAERMEERLRQRRKLQAREIHDTNLAEIAKNPETAAFAQAALMRPATHRGGGYQSGNDDPDDDGLLVGTDVFDLEERVDDHAIASTVQSHLVHTHRRIDSDVESDNEGAPRGGAASRIVGPTDGSQSSAAANTSFYDLDGGDLDGDLFASVSVEKLIVRRKTLMAAASSAPDTAGNAGGAQRAAGAWPPQMHGPRPVLKRPGVMLAGATTKRSNAHSKGREPNQ